MGKVGRTQKNKTPQCCDLAMKRRGIPVVKGMQVFWICLRCGKKVKAEC